MEEFKKELITSYEEHVIDCMNESGKLKIEEYIESFICWVDFNLRTNGEDMDNMENLFNTTDISEITEEIKKILYEYEKINLQ